VAKAAPDGYTVLFSTSAEITINQHLYTKMTYDPVNDLAPVSYAAHAALLLSAHPSVPADSLKSLIALARAKPGSLQYASAGTGSVHHLTGELFKTLAGIDLVHVPYKGATQATMAAVSGEVDQVIVSVASVLTLIQDKKVRPIVVLSESRVATIPDVPTSKEAGYPKLLMSIWYGLYAPAGTPPDIVARLNREAVRALESPDMKQRGAAMGIDPWPGTAEQLDQLTRSEMARYGLIVKGAGIKPE
jgi:tripartite-type tricarboxylate transporter receptor subunit TctC